MMSAYPERSLELTKTADARQPRRTTMSTYARPTPFAGVDREAQIWRALGVGHQMSAHRLRADALLDEAERERLARAAGTRRGGLGTGLASIRTILGTALIRT